MPNAPDTLRVGMAASLAEVARGVLPPGIEIVPLSAEGGPTGAAKLDVWVPPFSAKAAQPVAPRTKGVKLVQSLMAGVDWLKPMVPAGATLCDGRGVHDIPVAEWVVAAILVHLRRFPRLVHDQDEQQWRGQQAAFQGVPEQSPERSAPIRVLGDELHNKTVLIAGYGSIGEAVEARLAAFGTRILRVARTARTGVETMAALPELLPQADIVVLLLPLTDETRGLFNAELLGRMREGALLVNAARGPIVDTAALIERLSAGKLSAVLDVTDPEPLPPGHPLWTAPNCMITPHVAGGTAEFLPRALRLLADQCERLRSGEPLINVVTGDY